MFAKRSRVPGISIFLVLMALYACIQKTHPIEGQDNVDESSLLLSYLEQNGNVLNSPALPSIINASEVYENLDNPNYLVIDLRPKHEYMEGFIPKAVNVLPKEILDFFEQIIDPEPYEKIVLTCSNGSLSGYVNAVLLFLGYDNVSTLRFGMSSWRENIAGNYWLSAISDTLLGRLELTSNPKKMAGSLPLIYTGESIGRSILLKRAREILDVSLEKVEIGIGELLPNPEKFYLIGYWPERTYNEGHISGSIHYEPKKSLHSSEDIKTLPVDKPILLYCFSGHHTAFVTPFLRLLGYEAYNLSYGANSFIHSTMSKDSSPTRSFSQKSIGNYPVYIGREKID